MLALVMMRAAVADMLARCKPRKKTKEEGKKKEK